MDYLELATRELMKAYMGTKYDEHIAAVDRIANEYGLTQEESDCLKGVDFMTYTYDAMQLFEGELSVYEFIIEYFGGNLCVMLAFECAKMHVLNVACAGLPS